MNQISLGTSGVERSTMRTRKREFLDEMNLVVPWAELVGLIQPHAPAGKTGRPPFAVEMLLRIYFMQQWFALSDPAMREATVIGTAANVNDVTQGHCVAARRWGSGLRRCRLSGRDEAQRSQRRVMAGGHAPGPRSSIRFG